MLVCTTTCSFILSAKRPLLEFYFICKISPDCINDKASKNPVTSPATIQI